MSAAVEPGEMIETQWGVVDGKSISKATSHPPSIDVPWRNIVARIADNNRALEEGRHHIDPPLIGEKPMRNVIAAKIIRPARPPFRETFPLFGSANANKS